MRGGAEIANRMVIEAFVKQASIAIQRKRSEESLRHAVQRMSELEDIINKGPAVVFRWRNAEAWPVEFVSQNVSQFGYAQDDLVSGRVSWPGIIHPEDVPRREAEVKSYGEKGVTEFIQEYRLITKSGDARWVEDHTRVIADRRGRITHYEGIVLDITERKKAEQAMMDSEARLQEHKHALEMKTAALKELLEHIEWKRFQLEENVAANVNEVLLPMARKLKRCEGQARAARVELMESHLQQLISSFGKKISDPGARLTPREIEICSMIKGGLGSKEISGLLCISLKTVHNHRDAIRKKLGIQNKQINLAAYFQQQ